MPINNEVSAQSIIVNIEADPDIRNIHPDTAPKEIVLIARTNEQILEYQWKLTGPGKFLGNSNSPVILYIPPEKLDSEESKQTIVTVDVCDNKDHKATDMIIFTFESFQNISSQETPQIEELLKIAEAYFERTFFTEPKGGNAFDIYKEILSRDPGNSQAQKKIQEMLKLYQKWGNYEYNEKNYDRARHYYERYLLVAEYIIAQFKGQDIAIEVEKEQNRLKNLISILTPTPLPTPIPVPVPMPTPAVTPSILNNEKLKQLSQRLSENLGTYEQLIQQEKQGINVQEQIIPILENIIENLKELELFFRQSESSEMLQRIEAIKNAKEMFEQKYNALNP